MVSVLFWSVIDSLGLSLQISLLHHSDQGNYTWKRKKKIKHESVSVAVKHMTFNMVDKTHLVSCIKAIAFNKMGKLVWHSKENHVSKFSREWLYWFPSKIRMKMKVKRKMGCCLMCVISFLFQLPDLDNTKYQVRASSWPDFITKKNYTIMVA